MPAKPVARTLNGPRLTETSNASTNWLFVIETSSEPFAVAKPRNEIDPSMWSRKPGCTTAPPATAARA